MMYAHYGGVGRAERVTGHTPLDAVDPKIVGRVDVDTLETDFLRKWSEELSGSPSIMDNLQWIRDPEVYAAAMTRYIAKHGSGPNTRPTWHAHLESLRTWGICSVRQTASDTSPAVATSKYFAVLKEAALARSIIDCSDFSHILKSICDIQKIRLPTMPDLLRTFARHIHAAWKRKEAVGILLSDIRHFFHQIKLRAGVRVYFSVLLGTLQYLWHVVPMGHTVSPIVAQTISIALVLMTQGAHASGPLSQIPEFVACGRAVAAVWYDNLMAAGSLQAVLDLSTKWKDVCDRYCVTLKYRDVFKKAQLRADDTDEDRPVALGIRLAVDSQTGTLLFRHRLRNVSDWALQASTISPDMTLRRMARVLGVLLFDQYIASASDSFDPCPTLPSIARRIARDFFCYKQWDRAARYADAEADRSALSVRLTQLVNSNPFRAIGPIESVDPSVYICCDASGSRWGALSIDVGSNCVEGARSGSWTESTLHLHITAKEALAIYLAIKEIAVPRGGRVVRVVSDALAVVCAFKKGYSGSRVLSDIVARTRRLLRDHNMVLQIAWIPGVHNLSDVLTRPDRWNASSYQDLDWSAPAYAAELALSAAALRTPAPTVGYDAVKAEDVLIQMGEERRTIDGDSDITLPVSFESA